MYKICTIALFKLNAKVMFFYTNISLLLENDALNMIFSQSIYKSAQSTIICAKIWSVFHKKNAPIDWSIFNRNHILYDNHGA